MLYTMESFDKPENMYTMYVNFSKSLTLLGEHTEAGKYLLLACKDNATPLAWLEAAKHNYMVNTYLRISNSQSTILDWRLLNCGRIFD